MRLDNFTIKSQEVIELTINKAKEAKNPEVTDLHLLFALLTYDDSMAVSLFKKVGADTNNILNDVESALSLLASVQGSALEPNFSSSMRLILDFADKDKTNMKDDYVSVEHLILALFDARDTKSFDILKNNGDRKSVV